MWNNNKRQRHDSTLTLRSTMEMWMIHLSIFPLTFPVLLMFEVRKSYWLRERATAFERERNVLYYRGIHVAEEIQHFWFPFSTIELCFLCYGMRVFNKTWRGRENAPKMCSPNEFCGISQPSGKFSRGKLYENVESFFTSEMLYLLVSVHHSSVYLCHSLKWNKKKSLSKSFMQTWYV